jgi:hypothetical protein
MAAIVHPGDVITTRPGWGFDLPPRKRLLPFADPSRRDDLGAVAVSVGDLAERGATTAMWCTGRPVARCLLTTSFSTDLGPEPNVRLSPHRVLQ